MPSEYCLIQEDDTVFGCEVDHRRKTDNIGLCVRLLQSGKGQRYRFPVQGTGTYVRFFHPRLDYWAEHIPDGVKIVALSDIGDACILAFNTSERLLERQVLQDQVAIPVPGGGMTSRLNQL